MRNHTAAHTVSRMIFEILTEWDDVNRAVMNPKGAGNNYKNVREFLWWSHLTSPSQITPDLAQRWVVSLRQDPKNYAPSTIKYKLAGLSAFCRHLVDRGYLAHNPIRRIRTPAIVPAVPEYLTEPQIHRVLIWARRLGGYYEILTAYLTGMRRGELMITQWGDIKWDTGIIAVLGKGHKLRYIPLNTSLNEDFAVLRQPSGYLFPGKHGGHRAEKCWDNLLAPVRARVPEFTGGWHMLRKSFATNCLRKGVPLAKVAAWLGHSDPKLTMQTYGNMIVSAHDPEIDVLGASEFFADPNDKEI